MPTRLIFFSLHSAINLGQSSGGAPNLVPSGEDEWLSSVNMRNTMRALGNNWWIFSISSRLSKVIISTPLSFAYLMWSIVLHVKLTCYNSIIFEADIPGPLHGLAKMIRSGVTPMLKTSSISDLLAQSNPQPNWAKARTILMSGLDLTAAN